METIDAATLKSWLADGDEIALLDVREAGQFGEGHLFFAAPLAYSRFEPDLPALVPNVNARLVLSDDGDGIAEKAASRARAMGYRNISILDGGVAAWARAGFTLYKGVNLPSKTFGELIEHDRDTPRITAQELARMQADGDDIVIVDGRPFSEYNRMNIPGGICCPNGELALRISDIAPDPKTKIVVNCAGRTRSIIGAQTLIDFGVPNEVVALKDGTQGWVLAGFELERGATRAHDIAIDAGPLAPLQARAKEHAAKHGAEIVSASQVAAWLRDGKRTSYLFDVRTRDEFDSEVLPWAVHAPGGQLIQAGDQWIGVRGARVVLLDGEGVRAPMVAAWLRQLGHEAYVLQRREGEDLDVLLDVDRPTAPMHLSPTDMPAVSAAAVNADQQLDAGLQVVDLRDSMAFRKAHIPGAIWSIRPRAAQLAERLRPETTRLVLVADRPDIAALFAEEIAPLVSQPVAVLEGGMTAWLAAGLPVQSTPSDPPDDACIDFLFFTHDRHHGNEAAMRQYLAWETGLVDQLDEQERGAFRL